MKISLNSIRGLNKRYGCADDFKLSDAELVERVGAQLGGVEEVINLGERYNGIVIAKVVECNPVEGSDHLSVCRIDDGKAVKDVERGDDGLVQVVCGAPNCREGLLVAWLPPGSTVPSSFDDNEPFVLEARELRGHKSNGMLASPKELALGDSHDGILEIDGDPKPGSDFAEVFELANDTVLDIENKMFTHRPDCFGFLGVARELAGIQGHAFKSPDWYSQTASVPAPENDLPLTVQNELPELVPRFMVVAMSEVQVGPSPVWLQVELAKVGQKSVNNIVDLANFFMLETGQPLHAFDYDKVKSLSKGDPVITVRNPKPGEKIALLNGKTIEPRAEAIMIATDQQIIGIAGVMGGSETEVDENTKNIILECANFDMYSIRRTSMEHGLFTDAVTRFTKGQSPLQNLAVLARITDEIHKVAGGKVASAVIDDNHISQDAQTRQSLHPAVTVSADFVNERLGSSLKAQEIKTLLENVEFQAEVKGDELTIAAPFWRTDIELREDIVEEVGRLHGYDNLPLVLPTRDITPAQRNALLDAKNEIRDRLAKAGANEVLTYSFVHADLLSKVGQDSAKAFELSNALSPDLQHYRLSLMPSLLDKVHSNIKAGYDEFALFEIGKVHNSDHSDDGEGVPKEFELTALVLAANDKLKKPGTAYYAAQAYVRQFFADQQVRFKPLSEADLRQELTKPYDPVRSALVEVSGSPIGIVGEFKANVRRALKLPRYTAGFELDTELVAQNVASNNYQPLSRFPKVTQDITLRVEGKVDFAALEDSMIETCDKLGQNQIRINFAPMMVFLPDDDNHRNFSFRVNFVNYERTMTDKEVNGLMDELAESVKTKFGAERL